LQRRVVEPYAAHQACSPAARVLSSPLHPSLSCYEPPPDRIHTLHLVAPPTHKPAATRGTFHWSAPELLMGDRCTFSTDIYSMGVILWVSLVDAGGVMGVGLCDCEARHGTGRHVGEALAVGRVGS